MTMQRRSVLGYLIALVGTLILVQAFLAIPGTIATPACSSG
jgi:hypothetical protein